MTTDPTKFITLFLTLAGLSGSSCIVGCGPKPDVTTEQVQANTQANIDTMEAAALAAARSGLKLKGKVIAGGKPGVGQELKFYADTDTRIEFEFENDPATAAEFAKMKEADTNPDIVSGS